MCFFLWEVFPDEEPVGSATGYFHLMTSASHVIWNKYKAKSRAFPHLTVALLHSHTLTHNEEIT
jgi:hypothetical protein